MAPSRKRKGNNAVIKDKKVKFNESEKKISDPPRDVTENVNKDTADKSEEIAKECPICFEIPTETGELVCKHSFCYQCIFNWSEQENTCPLCKKRFQSINKIIMTVDKKNKQRKRQRKITVKSKDQGGNEYYRIHAFHHMFGPGPTFHLFHDNILPMLLTTHPMFASDSDDSTYDDEEPEALDEIEDYPFLLDRQGHSEYLRSPENLASDSDDSDDRDEDDSDDSDIFDAISEPNSISLVAIRGDRHPVGEIPVIDLTADEVPATTTPSSSISSSSSSSTLTSALASSAAEAATTLSRMHSTASSVSRYPVAVNLRSHSIQRRGNQNATINSSNHQSNSNSNTSSGSSRSGQGRQSGRPRFGSLRSMHTRSSSISNSNSMPNSSSTGRSTRRRNI